MIGGVAIEGATPACAADGVVARMRAREMAEAALRGLSDRDRVNFALHLILGTRDPRAAGLLSFAAGQVTEHAHCLMRASFERDCG